MEKIINWIKKRPTVMMNITIALLFITVTIIFVILPHYKDLKNENGVPADPKTLDGQIVLLNQKLKAYPQNIKTYISLSQVYLQKVRETADISYYQKINDLMDQAKKIDPSNPDIPETLASVELGRHHFKEGKQYAEQALALDPHNNLYFGSLGDADIELGQYSDAAAAFQKMVDLRPDYSAYIRIAYIRELYGDIAGAKDALITAINSGSSFNENIAFAYVELGKLDMRTSLDQATIDFNNANNVVANYPTAMEGLGKVAYFKGNMTEAEKDFTAAYNKLPIVQYANDLGDLYFKEGKTDEAKKYYTLGQLAFDGSEKSGVTTDLEESLFLSDHDIALTDALARAQRSYIARPSIYAADYLAWALYKNEQSDKAAQYEKESLRLGENEPLILFHQGMIAAKNGDKVKAKKYLSESLKANPYFSILQADEVTKTLNSLQ